MSGIWEHQDQSNRVELNLVRATKGKRFTNFLVDYICLMIAMSVLGGLLTLLGLDVFLIFEGAGVLGERLIGMLLFALYYLLIETALKGRSIGKILTGTRAVTIDGDVPDFDTILKRSLSRIVPFEAFSYLGERDGWHDRWSDTMVIDEKLSTFPEEDYIEDEYEY